MRLASLVLAFLFASLVPAAQTTDCVTGTAEGVLDAGDVRAGLYNIGGLFWRGREAVYEVPRYTGLTPVFNASLWVGGLVKDDVRLAGSRYGPWEFWPGPLDAAGRTTAEACAAHDRIWTVTAADLATYDNTSAATPDLADWPVGLGAPYYVDTNGNGRQDPSEATVSLDLGDPGYGARAIDLAAGERPVVFGAQTAWWVMNDRGGEHLAFKAPPLGIEVRVTAWTTGFSIDALAQSTFYRYDIFNRSTDTIRDAHAGLFVDADLGNFNDDYTHADSTRGMFVFYNGDEDDQGGGGYGSPPPAIGIDVLSGASAGLHLLKGGAGYPANEPNDGVQAYARLRGRLNDGSAMHVGGFGLEETGPTTAWSYSGDPITGAFWSNENIDGMGTAATPSDRRGMVSSEPATLPPGGRMTVDIAFVFGTGADRLDSIAKVRDHSDVAQSLYDAGSLTSLVEPPPPPPTPALGAPADGASATVGEIEFTWAPVPGAVQYRFEVLDGPDATEPIYERLTDRTQVVVDRFALPLNRRAPLVWRARAIREGVESLPTEAREVTIFVPAFGQFSVVANASGPLERPAPAAFAPRGYPALPDIGPRPAQQTTGAVWYVSADGALTYREFLGTALGDGNASRAFPKDYEIRFTGGAESLAWLGDRRAIVPFEVWDIGVGTPGDASDDVRLVPVVHDTDGDGRYSFHVDDVDFFWTTDPVSWHRPLDMSPGDRGYRAWAEGQTDRIGPEVLARTTFVRQHDQAVYDGGPRGPEPGTIVRLESSGQTLPLATEDEPAALALAVRPNPSATRATVGYVLAAPGAVRLCVVDVLGREVATLVDGDRPEGEHRAGLDTSRLAAGVYVVVLDAGGQQTSRTITVVR